MTGKPIYHSRRNNLATFFTVFFGTLGLLVVVAFIIIYQNPYVIFNPYPPTYPPPVIAQEQIDKAMVQTLAYLPTPTEKLIPTLTATLEHTPTFIENTPTSTIVPKTSTITPTPDSTFINISHQGSIVSPDAIFYTVTPTPLTGYIYSYILVHEPYLKESPYNENIANPLLNCNWIGVAGQVYDPLGIPIDGVLIRLSGSINGSEIKQKTMTSGESNLLGAGGFEFALGDDPFFSQNALWLQIIDEDGVPLSAKAHFSTTIHCTQNLIQIDFVRVQ